MKTSKKQFLTPLAIIILGGLYIARIISGSAPNFGNPWDVIVFLAWVVMIVYGLVWSYRKFVGKKTSKHRPG